MLRVSFVLQAAAKLTKPDHNLPRTIRARTDQTTDPVPEGKVVTGPTCDPYSRLCSHLCIALARATDIVPEPGPLLSYYTTCRELSCLELLSHRALRLLHIGHGIRYVAKLYRHVFQVAAAQPQTQCMGVPPRQLVPYIRELLQLETWACVCGSFDQRPISM